MECQHDGPSLSERLPVVECIARARMPTTFGVALYLHVYRNDLDDKEHMALVFGDSWWSRSLYVRRDQETEVDRIVRGVYSSPLTRGSLDVDDILQWSRGAADGTDGAGSMKRPPSNASLPQGSLNGVLPAHAHNATGKQGPQSSEADQACKENPDVAEPPLVRVHSECCTGDTFWSARCDCGEQLHEAARLISSALSRSPSSPGGIIIYLRQEGRGIGLVSKLKACNLQDLGFDTVDANLLLHKPADARSYSVATSMLLDLGCGGERGIKLLTNNPEKVKAVGGVDRVIKIKERIPLTPPAWKTHGRSGINGAELQQYVHTKIVKMGHMIDVDGLHGECMHE